MKEGFRQSMAWLHTWSGLLVGWVLFLVFAGGTSAYFREEISLWMKPELHAATAAGPVDAAQAAALALRHLQDQAAGSPRWSIDLPSEREPLLRTGWTVPQPAAAASAPRAAGERQRRARFASATLDPATGQPAAAARETRGGDFFYRLHFDLHYMSAIWGRWIVGFCAMFMLVAIVSGIVTHKRIFKDFFTFRPKKGQRSWLDAHNATAVLALPYHLMITYTGLVTLMFLYMPWGQEAVYKDDRATYIAEVFPSSSGFTNQRPAGVAAPLAPVAGLMREASAAWQGAPVSRIVVSNPGDATARVTLYRYEGGKLSSNQSSMTFDGTNGKLLGRAGEDIAPASETRGVLYGLHIGRFAHPLLRWLFFASGIAGCVMVATGLLLWSVKERQKYAKALAKGGRVGFGLRLVDGLNVGAVAGLPLAMAVFFWANRLVPVGIAERQATEIACFFWAWGLAAVAGLAWPARRMWQAQLALGGLLFALLPLLNPLTGGMGLATSLPAGEWRVAGFDLTVLALGAGLLAAAWTVGKRKPAAKPRAAAAKAEAQGLAPEPRLEAAGAGQ
ncbi:PepSY-associated TM helix domain-containing protein [Pseudorhodoferax sp.]|uniref:PepSY-associated TM helix domain-containing protein n=1 Tax=Pseudorhodoferax sp. TaxID=1993553 RepID=UPI002DD69AA0|nr:PepSY-associated TM helix domain-containing protein [Pseudorhodoferax sp.]